MKMMTFLFTTPFLQKLRVIYYIIPKEYLYFEKVKEQSHRVIYYIIPKDYLYFKKVKEQSHRTIYYIVPGSIYTFRFRNRGTG